MSILIIPEKKYCPQCYYTCKTDATHCPESANYPEVHDFKFTPLEVCKPDTSDMHKVARSRHQSKFQTDPERVKKVSELRQKKMGFQPIGNIDISIIRRLQDKRNEE